MQTHLILRRLLGCYIVKWCSFKLAQLIVDRGSAAAGSALIYKVEAASVHFERTGTHPDLFRE